MDAIFSLHSKKHTLELGIKMFQKEDQNNWLLNDARMDGVVAMEMKKRINMKYFLVVKPLGLVGCWNDRLSVGEKREDDYQVLFTQQAV